MVSGIGDERFSPGLEEASSQAEGLMTVPVEYRPNKSAEVLELDMGDGLILYNHDSSLVHHLNLSAAIVWHLCDGEVTVREMAERIAREYSLRPKDIVTQVSSTVAEFDALNLVVDGRNLARRSADG